MIFFLLSATTAAKAKERERLFRVTTGFCRSEYNFLYDMTIMRGSEMGIKQEGILWRQ